MRIDRPIPRRRGTNWTMIGCGCVGALALGVVILGVGLLLLLPVLPQLGLQAAGFSPKGDTDALFADVPPATIAVQNAVVPLEVVVDLGNYGQTTLQGETGAYQVRVGTSDSGSQLAIVTFSENGLMQMCYQRSDICSGANPQYRNARLDLRPGGAILYADVTIPDIGITQTVGVVMRLDGSRRQFEVAGVDIAGTLYTVPPNEFNTLVNDAQRTGNDILNQLTLEQGGTQYDLSEVQISDDTLTLVLR